MYGLKPVPFNLRPVAFMPRPELFKLKSVPFNV
jgi:hypothetical protein